MPNPRNQTPESKRPRVWVYNARRAGHFGWLGRYYTYSAIVAIALTVPVGVQCFRYFSAKCPSLEDVTGYRHSAPGVTRIYANNGATLAELAREYRSYVPIESIPQRIISAFLAAEDRRFFNHGGLDWRGLARAVVTNLRSGTVRQGGSTITQQIAKSFLRDQGRTLERKIVEAILALRVESKLEKSKILELYLNKIFLGNGAYGVSAAAARYFDKSLQELSLGEAAVIAGLARAPTRYNPLSNPELAKKRRSIVLQTMVDAGYINETERAEANDEAIATVERPDVFRWRAPYYAEEVRKKVSEELGDLAVLQDGLSIETPADLELHQYAQYAIHKASRSLDRRHGWRGPVAHLSLPKARTTFVDRITQAYADHPRNDTGRWYLALVTDIKSNRAEVNLGTIVATLPLRLARWASPYDRMSGESGEAIGTFRHTLEVGDVIWVQVLAKHANDIVPKVRLGQLPIVEAAIYSMDHNTGYVATIEGGLDYDRSQFNRTTQACRQPGSVFKAIYYGLALSGNKWKMDSILEAKPWEPEPGEDWNPRNIDKTIDGKVLLRTAFIKSLNTPSIRLFVALGAKRVVDWARSLGIKSTLIPDKGLSLGASCVLAQEMSNAFATYVRGGTKKPAVLAKRVVDKHGRTRIDRRDPNDSGLDIAGRINRMAETTMNPPKRIIDAKTSYLITWLLREVVTAGIGTRAGQIGVSAGGKSGSASGRFTRNGKTQDLTTDTWFIGFTSQHVTSAWMGFDDVRERSLGDLEASYTTATPMWAEYMGPVVEGLELGTVPPHRPSGLSSVMVDATRGGPPVEGLPQARIYYRR